MKRWDSAVKIAAITFHGSHNYGSMLQAYALQQYVTDLCCQKGVACDYSIINYRSAVQKDLYLQKPPTSLRGAAKLLMKLPYHKKLKEKSRAFEDFLQNFLHVTDEYSTETQLRAHCAAYDCYISGSDQIWNVRCRDFSFAYLLEFAQEKKISYAASLGPLDIDFSQYDQARFASALESYAHISVREEKSQKAIQELLGGKDCAIHVDPTLLLGKDDWRAIQSGMNIRNGQYILFYCLEPSPEHVKIAKAVSDSLKLPVVSTGYRNKHDYVNPFFKAYNAGPLDFLSLVDHAALVLTSSFHGAVFSILYHKPFWAIDGMRDGRIRTLLELVGAQRNSLEGGTAAEAIGKMPMPVFADDVIANERTRSRQYLEQALGLSEGSLAR